MKRAGKMVGGDSCRIWGTVGGWAKSNELLSAQGFGGGLGVARMVRWWTGKSEAFNEDKTGRWIASGDVTDSRSSISTWMPISTIALVWMAFVALTEIGWSACMVLTSVCSWAPETSLPSFAWTPEVRLVDPSIDDIGFSRSFFGERESRVKSSISISSSSWSLPIGIW